MMRKKLAQIAERIRSVKIDYAYFKPIGRIALIFFIGLSAYLFISSIVLLFLTKPDREVRVPGVVGRQFSDAYNGLVRRGLRPELKFRDVYDIDEGIILDQYPDPGDIVYEGSSLKLTVSRSAVFIDVPNLIGVELPFALNKLKNLHSHNRSIALPPGVISYVPSKKTADNIVIDQSPKAGEKVTPDRRVNLLVSSGAIEGEMSMPDIVGQSIDLCFDTLLARGLFVDEEVIESGLKEESGIVKAQSPDKGAAVSRGDTVRLKVAYYKPVERLYYAYERVEFNIDKDEDPGLYEAYVEDAGPKRIAFSRNMKPGQKMDFVFRRNGYARVSIVRNKKSLKTIRFDFETIK